MSTSKHIAVSIKGLEVRLRASRPNSRHGLWNILTDSEGRPLTYSEHWQEIWRCQKLGYEVITDDECNNLNEKGRCKGHKSSD